MIKNPLIGIIGGAGLMGQLFKTFFEKEGFKVQIADRKTELSIEKCAESSDVIIISVPMDKTIDVIKRIAPLVKENSLLMDLTSLKVNPVKTMLENSKCSVLGMHPVFGPGVQSFKNQTIILCPGRGEEWQKWIENIFRKKNIKIKVCSPQEHDKMMAIIQGMIHFTTITMTHVLKDMDIDVRESLEFSSPIYKLRLDMLGRIMNQDGNLYGNIEIMNPETKNVLNSYLKASNKLFKIIKKKNLKGFVDYFEDAADYLGDFKEEAEEFSNYLINMLVSK